MKSSADRVSAGAPPHRAPPVTSPYERMIAPAALSFPRFQSRAFFFFSSIGSLKRHPGEALHTNEVAGTDEGGAAAAAPPRGRFGARRKAPPLEASSPFDAFICFFCHILKNPTETCLSLLVLETTKGCRC